MPHSPQAVALARRIIIYVLCSLLLVSALAASGQERQPADAVELQPNQTLERELTGAETHRYRFNLRAGEFFQVRAEQKGVDVTLRLLGPDRTAVATTDSPNGKEGPETLSFVAEHAGPFVLQVNSLDAKASKGGYSIRREEPRKATARDRRRVEIERRFAEGMAARSDEGHPEKAITKLEDSLQGWRELEDSYLAGLTERQIKAIKLRPKTKALIAEFTAPGNLVTEGKKLIREAKPEAVLAARAKFLQAVEAARQFFKKLKAEDLSDILSKGDVADFQALTRASEVSALTGMGSTSDLLRDWQGSVNYKEQAIAVIREMRQDPEISGSAALTSFPPLKANEASLLGVIGTTFTSNLDKPREGLSYDTQALALWREVQRENEKYRPYAEFMEAQSLQTMAQSYLMLDDRNNAVALLEQALVIYRRLPDQKSAVAAILLQAGDVYFRQLDLENAQRVWDEALKICEELGDKQSQAMILNSIGLSYIGINDEKKAREYFNRELAVLLSDDYIESSLIRREVIPLPDYAGQPSVIPAFRRDELEWQRSVGVGNTYTFLGDHEKGRAHYEKSLASARATNSQGRVRLSLSFIGSTYERQEKWQEALDYYSQALKVSRLLPGRSDVAGDLSSVAFVNLQMKRWQDALQNAAESLLIYQSLGADRNNLFAGYAGALNLLARAQDGLGNRRLAIFYEKQAVNAIQRERQQLKNLDQQAQQGFLEKNEKPYRRLAEWLIAEGRFLDAERVLAMLKEEEYFDFVRRDAEEIKNLSQLVPLSDKEQKLIARYALLADRITDIGQQFLELDERKRKLPEGASLPADEQKRYEELSAQLADANAAFKLFLDKELVAELGNETTKEIEVDRNLQAKLRKWGEGTVALRTVVTEDRYRVILTTPVAQIDGKTEIKAADLNQKVFAFRDALQHPSIDPRPLGKELYDILIKPIEKELRVTGAKTLVWSLDGTLRYIPLAALSPDGKSYLVEKYQNVIITPKTRDDVSSPGAKWQALGVGVSDAESVPNPDKPGEELNFKPLRGAKEELLAIVRDEGTPNEKGVLPGKRYLDKDFTVKNFTDSLTKETADGKRRYTVVHVASHFHLGSNWSNSFLLLGDGQVLTLEQVNNSPEITFGDVELITLSACNTAFADESNGREVDSLAEVIQTKSGKAVLATLWSVADESTQVLMSEFYRLRKVNPQMTKTAALQLAQRKMIEGTLRPAAAFGRQRDTADMVGPNAGAAAFPYDLNKPYAHPYYWSSFVLIGNWR